MNRCLWDTNILSELRKPRPHGAVISWINDQQDEQLFGTSRDAGRVAGRIEQLRRRDPANASEIELWAEAMTTCYQILPMESLVATNRQTFSKMFERSSSVKFISV